MENLKPCPFCGGEAVRMDFLDNLPFKSVKGTRYFGCRKCCVVSFNGMTEAEAIEAWNTRAGRTCRNVYDLEKRGCENGFECSECGEIVADYESYKVKGTWNFCPGCGAKVVE